MMLQVPYELQDVNLWDGSNKKPEYLKMQVGCSIEGLCSARMTSL